nr:MAG TPA_asm: hypothetical protein [Caudoviricetes sp.]
MSGQLSFLGWLPAFLFWRKAGANAARGCPTKTQYVRYTESTISAMEITVKGT